MTETRGSVTEERSIVVVVGAESSARATAARTFISDGHSVLLCAGPPGCPLLRNEPCAIVDVADAVVLMPRSGGRRDVEAGLSLCAKEARCAVVVERTHPVAWPAEAIHVNADDL